MDPVSAFAIASSAYKIICKGFETGRSIEGMYGDLGRWMGAISDVKHAHSMAQKPSIFKKVFNGSSIEKEALDAFAFKKKAEEMEDQLRTHVNLVYGPNSWSEILKLQAKIRKERQQQIYEVQEFKRKIFNIVGIVLLCTIIGGVVMWIGYLFYLKRMGNL
tara:strand:- start:531 stop:1013 length:483 start_codon:yes stop_codon:yes gene_type:complete